MPATLDKIIAHLRQPIGVSLSRPRRRFGALASPLVFTCGSALLAFLINGSGIPLMGRTTLVFGSFFSVLTAMLFGPFWGAVTAFVAFTRTVIGSGDPTLLLCFTGEAVVVGWLSFRRHWNPILAVGTYWATVGIPLALFCALQWYKVGNSLLLALFCAANGLLMAAAASVLSNEIHRAVALRQETTRKLASAIAQRDLAKQQLQELDKSLDEKVSARTAKLHEAVTAAESANQASNEFFAGLTHDLRTPLNAIIGNAGLLLEQDPANHQRDPLRDIELSGHNLLRLITDAIDITKLDAGLIELAVQPTKIREASEASTRVVQDMVERKKLTFHFDMRHHSAVIWADSSRLKQILNNLLMHSVKIAPSAGRVEFFVFETSSPSTLHFLVRDFGFELDPAAQLGSLKPLGNDYGALRRSASYSLGLTIVKRLAELHGGSLAQGSPKGLGNAFVCSLPVDQAGKASGSRPPLVAAMPVKESGRTLGKNLADLTGSVT